MIQVSKANDPTTTPTTKTAMWKSAPESKTKNFLACVDAVENELFKLRVHGRYGICNELKEEARDIIEGFIRDINRACRIYGEDTQVSNTGTFGQWRDRFIKRLDDVGNPNC